MFSFSRSAVNSHKISQLVKYFFVGLFSTIVHFTVLYSLVDLFKVMQPVSASVVAFTFGALMGFFLNRNIVFQNSTAGFSALGKYFLLTGFSGTNNTILMYVLINMLHWHYLLAQAFAIGIIFLFNFTVCRLWIFREYT